MFLFVCISFDVHTHLWFSIFSIVKLHSHWAGNAEGSFFGKNLYTSNHVKITTCWISLKFWSYFSLHFSHQSDSYSLYLAPSMCPQLCQHYTNLEYKAQGSALKELKYGSGDNIIITKQLDVTYSIGWCHHTFIPSTSIYWVLLYTDLLLGVRDIAFNKTWNFFFLHGACILLEEADNRKQIHTVFPHV